METTTKQFQRLAERRFRQINPDVPDVLMNWTFTSDGFIPDRSGGGATMHGSFLARAEGHAVRRINATMVQGESDVSLR